MDDYPLTFNMVLQVGNKRGNIKIFMREVYCTCKPIFYFICINEPGSYIAGDRRGQTSSKIMDDVAHKECFFSLIDGSWVVPLTLPFSHLVNDFAKFQDKGCCQCMAPSESLTNL